jgi:hypothetical protein
LAMVVVPVAIGVEKSPRRIAKRNGEIGEARRRRCVREVLCVCPLWLNVAAWRLWLVSGGCGAAALLSRWSG